MKLHQPIRQFFSKYAKKFTEFNTFQSVPPSHDPHTLRNQKLSTWLFILLLGTLIISLVVYNVLVSIRQTFTVEQPSYTQYVDLSSKYPNNLQCPCTRVSVKYDRFLALNYTLISMCSTFLVSDQWIEYLTGPYLRGGLCHDDFHAVSYLAFQALRVLCQLTNETIQNSLTSFYDSQYVSADLTSAYLFQQQNEAKIRQFISSSTETFLSSLSLIRQTTQANALFAATQTNYDTYTNGMHLLYLRDFFPVDYSGCSCSKTASCFAPAVMYTANRNTILFGVPGFYTGCFIVESLLISTLECFYDELCLNNVTYYVNSTLPLNVTALNASMSTRFKPNSTVKEMLDELMVEEWVWNITFAKYFDACEPSQCTYTIASKNDAIFIVTTVLGLVGGLVTILRIMVPRLIEYLRSQRSHVEAKKGEWCG